MDIVERLRSGEDGLEYAAAIEIEDLRAQLQKALKWRSAMDDAYTQLRAPMEDNPSDALQQLIRIKVLAASKVVSHDP